MNLAEKITALRKRSGWSQEELAERMEVSRQAVSKWEMGASIPDVDNIVRLSALFDVTTDFLLHDERTAEETAASGEAKNEGRAVTAKEAADYLGTVEGAAAPIAWAVALFILSPVCLIELLALGGGAFSENLSIAVGVGVLLLLVALGVAEIIPRAMRLSRYGYLGREKLALQCGVRDAVLQRKSDYEEQHRQAIMQGCVLCISSVLPLVVAACLEAGEGIILTCVSVLLALVAAGVFFLVRTGMIYGGYQKLLQEAEYAVKNKEIEKRMEAVAQLYWMAVTAAYLAWSFLTNSWGISWIVWPLAGILFGAVQIIVRLTGSK